MVFVHMQSSRTRFAQPGTSILNWPMIVVALLVISPIALGVHAYMLDVRHIPYPQRDGVPIWAKYINEVGSAAAYIIFCGLARDRLSSRFFRRLLVVAAIYCGLRATLRLFFINSYLTGAWIYQGLTSSVRIIEFAIIVTVILLATPFLRGWRSRLIGGLAIAAIATFAIKPAMALMFAPAFDALSALDFPEFRLPPYNFQDNLVIYATYAETTVSCFAIAYLSWPALSERVWARMVQFAALIMFMKQSFVPTFLYSPFELLPWPQAALSESQFALETLALAVMTALIWPFCQRRNAAGDTAQELHKP